MMRGPLHFHGLMDHLPPRQVSAPPHDLLRCGPFCALTSPWDSALDLEQQTSETAVEKALHHHNLLLSYCDRGALLPMRFGTVFSTPSALQSAVSTRADLYREALATLAGLRAYVLQVDVCAHPKQEPERVANGRDFLRRRRNARDTRVSSQAARRAFVDRVADECARLSAMPATAGRRSSERLLDLTVLVEKATLPRLSDLAVERGSEGQALGLALKVTGPWPAYTFDPGQLRQLEMCDGA